jgi:hypothetical protein
LATRFISASLAIDHSPSLYYPILVGADELLFNMAVEAAMAVE